MPIKCQDRECSSNAICCIEWRTPSMSAPAFWYMCGEHMNRTIEGLGLAHIKTTWLPGTARIVGKEVHSV